MCRALAYTFVLCAVLTRNHVVEGQVPADAQKFFNNAEQSVKDIAAQVLVNYQNRAESLATCATRCSILSCETKVLGLTDSECLSIPGLQDSVCGGPLNGCKNASVSHRSYVRLSPQASQNDLSCNAKLTICAQNQLEATFEKVYAEDGGPFNKLSWSFYGAYNGIFRIYPGLELPPENCSNLNYDPRKRPWYRATLGVSKDVIVLLDAGRSMASPLALSEGQKILLTAAQAMVKEFLETLSTDDVVSVYSFTDKGATPVGKIKISANITAPDPNVLELKASIDAISRMVTSNGPQANLTAALTSVLGEGGQQDDIANLKVILIITGGELADGPLIDLPPNITQAVKDRQVRTFFFSLSDETVADTTDLKALACNLGGSYEHIDRNGILDDPISALHNFYNYVAKLRFSLDDERVLWVPSYSAFTLDSPVMTVTYPVFDGDFFIGAVALDLITGAIEEKWGLRVIDDWRKPSVNIVDRGQPLSCNISVVRDATACSNNTVPGGGLCSFEPLDSKGYLGRTCCDSSCGVPTDPTKETSGSVFDKAGSKAGIIGGSIVGFFLLLLGLYLARRRLWRLCNDCIMAIPSSTTGNPRPEGPSPPSGGLSYAHVSPVEQKASGTSPISNKKSKPRSSPIPHPPGSGEGKVKAPSATSGYDIAL